METFKLMLDEMVERLEAQSGHIEMTFPYFVNKAAPISKVRSVMDYEVTFVGEIDKGEKCFKMKVVVPVTSLCPCSKRISDYGAHNQRSHVTITARTKGFVWIEELVDYAEKHASSELYGLLKRPDEKFVTERAYDNPKFVEDMVRDIAAELNRDKRIEWYQVESENFESIHNHSAYALIEKESGIRWSRRTSSPSITILRTHLSRRIRRRSNRRPGRARQNRRISTIVWPSRFISMRFRKLIPSSANGIGLPSITAASTLLTRMSPTRTVSSFTR